jgi:tetraprenyl-beta-curcumene synthase
MVATREMVAVGWALGLYRSRILPAARRHLRGWEGRAAEISDPELREAATKALRLKRGNPEATAVFALLAPRRLRPIALRAGIALQLAVDYLDELTERPEISLEESLSLHRALVDALTPTPAPEPGWAELPDGGYLGALVDACRRDLLCLPAANAVLGEAQAAADRCATGQSYTNANSEQLRGWADTEQELPVYHWWEVAAGASSSVAIHALIAAAAEPATRVDDAALVAAAYFPPVGALTVLLDDLVDLEQDLAGGRHNYMDYYLDGEAAASRLALIASLARSAIEPLPHRLTHLAILAGVAGFYLSAPEARTGFGWPARERLVEAIGPAVRPVLMTMRLAGRG